MSVIMLALRERPYLLKIHTKENLEWDNEFDAESFAYHDLQIADYLLNLNQYEI